MKKLLVISLLLLIGGYGFGQNKTFLEQEFNTKGSITSIIHLAISYGNFLDTTYQDTSTTVMLLDTGNNWISSYTYAKIGETYDTIRRCGLNNKIMKCVCSENDTILYSFEIDGFINGQNSNTRFYDSNGKLSQNNYYTFDQNGNLLRSERTDAFGDLIGKDSIYYNEQGSKIKYDLVNKSTIEYHYDDRGNIIHSGSVNWNGYESEEKYKYLFDNRGNWIERTLYWGSILKLKEVLIIEYAK